jgi:hypothetical protein
MEITAVPYHQQLFANSNPLGWLGYLVEMEMWHNMRGVVVCEHLAPVRQFGAAVPEPESISSSSRRVREIRTPIQSFVESPTARMDTSGPSIEVSEPLEGPPPDYDATQTNPDWLLALKLPVPPIARDEILPLLIQEYKNEHAIKDALQMTGNRFDRYSLRVDDPPLVLFRVEARIATEARATRTADEPWDGSSVYGQPTTAPTWGFPADVPAGFPGQQVNGGSQTIRIAGSENRTTCPDCSGQGRTRCSSCGGVGRSRCFSCSGTGTRLHSRSSHGPGGFHNHTYRSRCYSCHGTGRSSCWTCGGTGRTTCGRCAGTGGIVQFQVVDVTWLGL